MKLGVFTSVCEEDKHWLPQYVAEMERLQWPFVLHFDKCSQETIDSVQSELCVGKTIYQGKEPFDERHKQDSLDKVVALDFDWAINVDVDETFEKDAAEKVKSLETRTEAVLDYKWVCLWDDPKFIRVDGPLAGGHRTRLYNLRSGYRWFFYGPTINGAAAMTKEGKQFKRADVGIGKIDLVCIHWGILTKDDRVFHKERWDTLYGRHTRDGKNPYGFWDWTLDETITPKLIEHDYFP